MSVRPHPKKTGHWIIDFYPQGRKGKRERVPFEGTEVQALAIELELRRETKQVRTRLFPRIEEVIPDFMNYYKLDHQPRGIERTLLSFKTLLPFFGKYQFTHITDTFVDQYKTKRLDTVTPSTINKELAALSSLCKWAAESERGYCNEIKIKRFPGKLTKAAIPVILSIEEVLALINEVSQIKRGVVAAMYYGGLRSSEARLLQRENVFIDQGILIIRGKGNKQRIVPIMKDLVPYLKAANNEGYLWLNPRTEKPWGTLRKAIFGAAKRAGIKKHVTAHLLRHCFGTHSTASGVGLRTLQDVMGHSSSQTTELYTTLATGHLIEGMKSFSDYSSQGTSATNDDKTI